MTTVVALKNGSAKFKGKETETLRFALKDVWFYFLTTSPRPNKGKKFIPEFPAKDSSYSVQVLVSDEDVLDEIEKSKSRDGYSKVTRAVVKREDFVEQFKCEPPFEAKKYYFLKLNRHAAFADGATYPGSHFVPMDVVKDGQRIQYTIDSIKYQKAKKHSDHDDKKIYDAIGLDLMVGNGSKGHVILAGSWYEFEGEVNQKAIQESFIITDLIEYVSSGKTTEISDEEADLLGLSGLTTTAAAAPKQSQPSSPSDEVNDAGGDDDDDAPLDDDDFQTE